ncbi:MAG: sigma-70 family RNA polymerase sigma factor [Deltaproteobacteria bacterium]|nr:sigma-70 family RNA polymerase sigma factor [Deltaproteobacteria bacterium]
MHHHHDDTHDATRVKTLVAEHRRFLGYLERRIGDRALAEDILQEAFVKSLGRLPAGDDEKLVAWFFRVLKNTITDQHRRTDARGRALDRLAHELAQATSDAELEAEACRCVLALSEHLEPNYRDALRRIEVDGLAVKDFALEVGITPQNAAVRVFRARRALERELAKACGTCATHGCLDCSCQDAPPRTGLA